MVLEIKNIVEWLKQWFYDKSEVYAKSETYDTTTLNNKLAEKVSVDQGSGNANKNVVTGSGGAVTVEPKVTTGSGLSFDNNVANKINHTSSVNAQSSSALKKVTFNDTGHITGTADPYTSDLKNNTAYNNIKAGESTTLTLTNQELINSAINDKFEAIANIGSFVIDTGDASGNPTTIPSASTMNQIYLVKATSGKDDNYNEFITVRSGSSGSYTYAWEKIGSTTMDLSGYALVDHVHGQITNDGKITSTAVTVAIGDNIVITDADDSSKVKRVANLLASHITDPNQHIHIDSSANSTQSTINTEIDSRLYELQQVVHDTNVFYLDDGALPDSPLYTRHDMYIVNDSGDWKLYYWVRNSSYEDVLTHVTLSKKVTSYSLVLKDNDPTSDASKGMIKIYFGDEPSGS